MLLQPLLFAYSCHTIAQNEEALEAYYGFATIDA